MKFKSDIEVQAGLKDSSGALGLSGQILSSTSGNVSWVTPTVNTVARDVQNEVKAGVAINKGQAVYVTGADGTNIIVGLASNATEATSSKTLGLLNATVAVNGFADVVQIGRLSGLNTLGATAGDPVWLGTGGNLIYGLINKPYAPANLVFIGIVTRVNVNNGEIFVNVQNGFELNEIHDVDLKTTVPINGDILGYDGTLWVNKTIAQWLGYTPANASGTTNYVSKFTGTTTLGNSQLFDNGTNVGIGTTTPTKKLDVNGGLVVGMEPAPFWNAKFKDYSDGSAIYISTVNGGGGKFIAGNAYYNNSLQWWSDKTTASAINLDNGAIVLYTNSGLTPNTNFTPSEKMRVTPGGNVGIGTASPSQKLNIASDGYNFRLSNNTNASGYNIGRNVTDGLLYLYGDQTGYNGFVFSGVDGERMRITATGNVGIGTTSPSSILDVQSAAAVVGPTLKVSNTNTGGGNLLQLDRATNSRVNGINFSTAGVEDWSLGVLRNGGSPTQVFSLSYQSGHNINSTGFAVTSAGNVGIGTTTPGQLLDVSGTGMVKQLYINYANNDFISNINFPAIYGTFNSGAAYPFLTAGNLIIQPRTTLGRDIVFANGATTPTVKMVIDSTGNVGIGTTTPTNRLHVLGGILNGAVATFSGQNLNRGLVVSTFNSGNSDAGVLLNAQTALGVLAFATVGSERMRITSGGNVGIGTTSPGAQLDVFANLRISSATDNILQFKRTDSNTNYGSKIYTTGSFAQVLNFDFDSENQSIYGGFNITSHNGTNNFFNIIDNGNVGIGTTSPTQKLEVIGTSYFSNDIYVGANKGIFFSGNGAYNTGIYSSGGDFLFQTSGVEKMRLNSSGNVGIGTTTPYSKLDVGGAISMNGAYFAANNATYTQIYKAQSNSVGLYIGGAGDPQNYYDNTQHFFRSSGGGTTYAIIDSSGNVGIGTSSPTYPLDVYNTGASTARIRVVGTSNFALLQAQNTSGTFYMGIDDSTGSGFAQGNYTRVIYSSSSYPLAITVNDAERMRIATTGAVKFNSYGSGSFTGTATQKLAVDSSGNIIEIPIGAGPVDGSGTTNFVTKWTDADTIGNSQIFDNGTNVGIGTTSPNTILSVVKTETFNGYTDFVQLADNTNGLRISDYWDSSGIRWDLRRGTTPMMSFSQSNNVGIGTTSPLRKLHVAGDFAVNANGSQYYGVYIPANGEGANPTILVGDWWNASGNLTWDSSNKVFNINSLYGSSAAPITFSGNGAERMRITAAGNVGIGTSSPYTKLDVRNGTFAVTSSDFASGTTGSIISILLGASTGNTYSTIQAGINGNSAVGNLVLQEYGGNVGIGTTTPTQKLDIVGKGKFSSSVQVGDDSATASATNVGATRYRSDANNSYMDMVMQTGASTYAWVNVVQNTWI